MAFTNLCRVDQVPKGLTATFKIEAHEVLLVRPDGGELRAFEGRCPHQLVSLEHALFDGRTLTCQLHRWTFDVNTGRCRPPRSAALTQYPLRIEEGMVQVDMAAAIS
jgi:toluene monooxygenase system ferredoxin subunit